MFADVVSFVGACRSFEAGPTRVLVDHYNCSYRHKQNPVLKDLLETHLGRVNKFDDKEKNVILLGRVDTLHD